MPTAARDSEPYIGIASLLRRSLSGENLSHLVNMAAFNPDSANMLMSLSVIFQLTGSRAVGLEMQARALQMRQLYHLPSATGRVGVRLLAIMRPGDMMDNTPVDFLLEETDVALDTLYVADDLPFPAALPECDVILVAIGQSDQNQTLLERLCGLLATSSRPVLNRPERIMHLSRDGVSALLQSIPGVEMPVALRINRQDLQQISRGAKSLAALGCADFPIIARPLGSQAGIGLEKLDGADAIEKYLNATPDQEFHIARFVDYRSADGLYRKYRIALIDGVPYACHMAISDNWMIHFKNAGMEASAAKRAEEASFMAGFDAGFGRRHRAACLSIAERLQMDYLVMDCAENSKGDLLVFEADNLGLIHAMDPVDIYPYKQPQMHKVFAAFHAMLGKAMSR
jgi:hypothetical protein